MSFLLYMVDAVPAGHLKSCSGVCIMDTSKAFADLSVDHGTWRVHATSCDHSDSDEEDGAEDGSILVTVVDSNRHLLGAKTIKVTQPGAEWALSDLLIECILQPLSGQSRLPKHVRLLSSVPQQKIAHNLVEAGIIFTGKQIDVIPHPQGKTMVSHTMKVKQCHECHLKGSAQLLDICRECEAVFFCSSKCDQFDTSLSGWHKQWCSQLKKFTERTETLAMGPFLFMTETCSGEFTQEDYYDFLQKRELFGKGLWEAESTSTTSNISITQDGGSSLEELYIVSEARLLDERAAVLKLDQPLGDWEAYYKWRGFSLDSPLAILLHWPLTVYHILANMSSVLNISQFTKGERRSINVHLVGVKKEISLLSTFKELGHLLPQFELHITMVGPAVPSQLHRCYKLMDNVKVLLLKGLYHAQHMLDIKQPDIIIGLNAGIGCFPSWADTLQKIQTMAVPAFFSDYCEYSCESSRQAVQQLKGLKLSQPQINPFRNPVRIYCEEHNLPWYSNCFIMSLLLPS